MTMYIEVQASVMLSLNAFAVLCGTPVIRNSKCVTDRDNS